MKRLMVAGTVLATVVLPSTGCVAQDDGSVPTFEVDALWPQPLAYPSILGPVSGVTVAPDGNVLILTRQDGFSAANEVNSTTGTGTCCTPSKAVLEFAPDGSLVREWGGPDEGYPWPQRPHAIAVDPDGNLWIGGGVVQGGRGGGRGGRGGAGGAAAGPTADTQILKFSRTGQHLVTIGGEGEEFGGVAGFTFDEDAGEVFVADGYAHRRVAVLDMTTGEVKRSWGAYGNAPDESELAPYDPAASPAQQFRSVTCVALANDGLLYVCDEGNDRIQVFQTDGTFVKEAVIAGETRGTGSVTDVAFSSDGGQRFLYVSDGMNERVYIVDRETLEVRTSFGVGGRYPSHFRELGMVATDGEGNVYTAEDGQGRRVQKFRYLGMGPVTTMHQGALYPGGRP